MKRILLLSVLLAMVPVVRAQRYADEETHRELRNLQPELAKPWIDSARVRQSLRGIESSKFRSFGYAAVREMAVTAPGKRRELLEILCEGLADPGVSARVAHYLVDFDAPCFSNHARTWLSWFLTDAELNRENILVIGSAHLKDLMPRLRQVAGEGIVNAGESHDDIPPLWFGSEQWAALLALARLGDDSAIAEVVKTVEEVRGLHHRILLMQDLGYIRQPEGIALLIKYFNSDDRLPESHPRRKPEPVHWRPGIQLAVTVVGFPQVPALSKGYLPVPPADLELCRKWLAEHDGEWQFRTLCGEKSLP